MHRIQITDAKDCKYYLKIKENGSFYWGALDSSTGIESRALALSLGKLLVSKYEGKNMRFALITWEEHELN